MTMTTETPAADQVRHLSASPRDGIYLAAGGRALVHAVDRDVLTPGQFPSRRVTRVSGDALCDEHGMICTTTTDFAILPRPGDLILEPATVAGHVIRATPTSAGNLTLVSVRDGEVVTVEVAAHAADPRYALTTPTTDERADLVAALIAVHAKVETAEAHVKAAARRLDSIVEDAHEWADEENLCSKFDRFCEEHNLPAREREWRVSVNVSTTVTVYVTASSEQDARDLVDSGNVTRALRDAYLDGDDWDVDEAEVND